MQKKFIFFPFFLFSTPKKVKFQFFCDFYPRSDSMFSTPVFTEIVSVLSVFETQIRVQKTNHRAYKNTP